MAEPVAQQFLLLITDRQAADVATRCDLLAGVSQLKTVPVEYATSAGEPLVFFSSAENSELVPNEIALILIDLAESSGTPEQSLEESLRLLGRVRRSEAFAHTPVLVVGQPPTAEWLHDLFEAGMADFLNSGPTLAIELVPRVRAALQRSQQWYGMQRKTGELQRMTEDLKTANIIFRSISIHDDLTGVANRRFFDRYLDTVWRQSLRSAGPVSLILIDIDYFKKYNDTYGHQAGDECLREVARAMEKALDEHGCILARYGGEEFGAILPGLDSEQSRRAADRLREVVYNLAIEHSGSPEYGRVTISQGIATAIPGLLTRPSQLIAKADRALYQAKADGRNRSVA